MEHHLEPEVAGPPPRAARLPLGTTALLLVAALLFGLFLYGGSRALLEALKLAWLGIGGRTVTAHIAEIQTEPSPVKGQPPRQTGLRYVFDMPAGAGSRQLAGFARLYVDDSSASVDGTGALPGGHIGSPRTPRGARPAPPPPVFHIGDRLVLRTAPWPGGPINHPWRPPPYGKMLFLTLSGGLVVGVSLLLLRRIARWRSHRLHLLRNGIATIGTIVHKHANADDSLRYFVRYGYAVAPGGAAHEHEEQCNSDQWKSFDIGQPVTVLYDPARPEEAGLYSLIGRK